MTSPAQLYLFAREIPLTKGYVALVDLDDYERLSAHKWTADLFRDRVYAIRRTSRKVGHKKVYMHREIMGEPDGFQVDHREGIGLDNRKHNLRVATITQQRANQGPRKDNTTGYKGVRVVKRKNGVAYTARINFKGKSYHGGTHRTKIAANAAYLDLARKLFGEFARAG